MSAIEIEAGEGRGGGRRRPSRGASAADDRRTALNRALAVFLIAFVALAPVPLGGNTPLFWTFSATLVGVIAFVYFAALLLIGLPLRVPARSVAVPALLWLALVLYLIVQVLPAGLLGLSHEIARPDGTAFASTTLSLAPGQTLLMALRWGAYGVFFALALQISGNRNRVDSVLTALLFVIAAHAVYGLAAVSILGDPLGLFGEKTSHLGSATGTFVNRNSYATFLAIGAAIGAAQVLRALSSRAFEIGGKRSPKGDKLAEVGLYAVATLLILAALLASQSRMGFFAGMCGVGFVVAGARLKLMGEKGGLLGKAGTWIIALVLIIALVGFGAGTLDRLGSVEGAADVRLDLYAQVLSMIGHNWFWGYGGGSFEVAYPLFHRFPVSPDLVWDKAHNTYLTLWSELGLLFGSIPLLIYAIFALRMVRNLVSQDSDWWTALIGLAVLLIVGVHSLVDFSMEMQANVFLVLLMTALGVVNRSRALRPATRGRTAS